MKPIFSDEERAQAVRIFLVACKNKQARITSYKEITDYLQSGRVKLLCDIPRSGQGPAVYKGAVFEGYKRIFLDIDAQTYWEWLVGVVSGTETEGVTEDIIKQATDQLFHFIHIMQNANDISMDKNIQLVVPYDWQKLFTSFDQRLTKMQEIIDKGDKDTIEVLKSLLQLLKENKILLKTLSKDSEELFGKR